MPTTHHIVLADEPTTEELLDRLDPILEQIDTEHDVFFGDPAAEEVDGVTIHTFADQSDSGHTLTLVDDPQSGRHLAVEGPKAAAIGSILEDDLVELAVSPEEAVSQARSTMAPRDVLRAALAQGDAPTPLAREVIAHALRSSDPDLIDAGITAAAMTDPRQFTEDLERLESDAPDDGLKLMAQQALAGGGRN